MNKSTLVTRMFSGAVEFGNSYFTISSLFYKNDKKVFAKVEVMLVLLIILCVLALFNIGKLSFVGGLSVCILFSQRVLEYMIVYSRNFILHRGRVFTDFPDKKSRGEWLLIMFLLNLLQVVLVFALWYQFLSLQIPGSFSQHIGILDGFYLSVVTFFTLGFGDIVPVYAVPKLIVAFESFLSFYTFLIVINGLIGLHFARAQEH